jgi:hypothetical protein
MAIRAADAACLIGKIASMSERRYRNAPVIKMCIERGSVALPIPHQARQHINVIAATQGLDAARKVAEELEQFERSGGTVVLPPTATCAGFHHLKG